MPILNTNVEKQNIVFYRYFLRLIGILALLNPIHFFIEPNVYLYFSKKMKSPFFKVAVHGTHSLVVPDKIALPFVEKGHSRVKVLATFESKTISFFAALRKYHGQYIMMFSKNKQKELGLLPNAAFLLQLFEDTSKYGVEVPEEFEAVLMSDYNAHEIFESFTKGKQRGIIYMILGFKDSQKRIDKSLLLCENLKRGIRDNRELLKSF